MQRVTRYTASARPAVDDGADRAAAARMDAYRAEWSRNPAMRAEFGDRFEAYAAYRKAKDRGLARIMGARN